MGRLVRRFIRVYDITVTHQLSISRAIAIDHSGVIYGARTIINVAANVTQVGHTRGHSVEVNVNAGATVPSYLSGIHISMYAEGTAILTALSVIYISNYVCVQPTSRYAFLDIRDNGPGITVDCFAYVRVASDIDQLFELHGNTTAWKPNTVPPGAITGRIRVLCGGFQRYLALHN